MSLNVRVVLKRDEDACFGFSLLGCSGPPHVIYDIIENSSAAACEVMEPGDVIVKVNGIDVVKYTTKEVLRLLRLSGHVITLELKKASTIIKDLLDNGKCPGGHHHSSDFKKENSYYLKQQLTSSDLSQVKKTEELEYKHYSPAGIQFVQSVCSTSAIPSTYKEPILKKTKNCLEFDSKNRKCRIVKKSDCMIDVGKNEYSDTTFVNKIADADRCRDNNEEHISPGKKNRFDAFMMTGDLIINLSRTPQKCTALSMDSDQTDYSSCHSQDIAPKALFETSQLSSSSSSSSPSSGSLCFPTQPALYNSSEKLNLEKTNDKVLINETLPVHFFTNNTKFPSCRKNSHLNNKLLSISPKREDEKYFFSSPKIINKKTSDENQLHFSKAETADIKAKDQIEPFPMSKKSENCNFSYEETVIGNVLEESSEKSTIVFQTAPLKSQRRQYDDSSLSSLLLTEKCEINTLQKESSFSVPVSPISSSIDVVTKDITLNCAESSTNSTANKQHNGVMRKCDSAGFRTSKSEDHLQQIHHEELASGIFTDIDEDVNSSLNTLMNTKTEAENLQVLTCERIVWTYNAPIEPHNLHFLNGTTSSQSSTLSISPPNTISPTSPTSISSSAISSHGSKEICGTNVFQIQTSDILYQSINNGDQSVSEVISNISSPDYQDDNLLSSRDLIGMILSDPSDSDSTIITSETILQNSKECPKQSKNQHKLVIQIMGLDASKTISPLRDGKEEVEVPIEETINNSFDMDMSTSIYITDDFTSDAESVNSYRYSPKAVDMPSAIRLAKRLFSLDGFRKSDVSRHLSKNNDFSKAVADEYLKYFTFSNKTLDESLRDFLQQFALCGETQERERVLTHFSKRYLVCNPGTFKSQDAVHTLTCAIMLLNADLHSGTVKRKMTCTEFIENLAELNDGENFSKEVLKNLYQAIKSQPLKWAIDTEVGDQEIEQKGDENEKITAYLQDDDNSATEYKKGYMMRKCCFDMNNKKTPFGKRSWKMFFCTLRNLVLYLHKDEHGFRKSQMSDNLHNAIRVHHALATEATDYTKKQHVFRLQTADRAEYLFQTSDSKELLSWIKTINLVCALFSAPSLEGGVGSQKRFQRPLLPSTHTKHNMQEQTRSHIRQIKELEESLEKHKKCVQPTKGLSLQNYKEKENYLFNESQRYKTYLSTLNVKLLSEPQFDYTTNVESISAESDIISTLVNE